MSTFHSSRYAGGVAAGLLIAITLMNPLDAWQAAGTGTCRISGRATSGATPLPGVAITIKAGDAVRVATSTEPDGGFAINLAPGEYTLTAELTGFTRVQRPLVVTPDAGSPSAPATGDKCAQSVDLALALAPRQPSTAAARGPQRGGTAVNVVQVQPQADAAAQAAAGAEREPDEASATRLLLPPGFSTEAPSDAIAITGNNASLDRGMLNDRFEAIGRGEFNPMTGEYAEGFGPPDRAAALQGRGGPGGFGPPGAGRGGPGGPGEGRGNFVVGGRGGRQNTYTAMVNYTFGGSPLDSASDRTQPG